ncbi:transglycosylase SLT domain-containing protein [Rubellimicrobium sp. CFH 75288]|uniref:transglycosylase SLT domain-containing protein n=1 Tax=Rubellimicrobium sp. CFH 75288 TaxID=2697034 RepID=UPI001FB80717|nr:transglycosylase SLT domain-containing protein [Rubellimicrobium sp. CFH 75288]
MPPEETPPEPEALPVMAWDHQGPHTNEWTEATLAALHEEGAVLLSQIPRDIGTWCPAYVQAEPSQRAAFWAGLLSALARFESTWNPRAVGGGGQWFGLVQIAPSTARGYGCEARSGAALTDALANLECAVRIAARTVTRDGVVAAGGGGFAADWGPFASASKRQEMARWVSSQEYCRA